MGVIISIGLYLIGVQIYDADFKLLTGKYNYKIELCQFLTYIASACSLGLLYLDISHLEVGILIGNLIIAYFLSLTIEFFLSKLNSQKRFVSLSIRCFVVLLSSIALLKSEMWTYTFFVLQGWYMRNCNFGAVHIKDLTIAAYLKRWTRYQVMTSKNASEIPCEIPCFAYAGNNKVMPQLKEYNVADYGIKPNTGTDLIKIIQALIDEVGKKGGGKIFFPKGIYKFNNNGYQFLKINYSNISIEGELSERGEQLTTFINCGNLAREDKHPWLSPFFITTGESLQESNMFWGLQFRKRKMRTMRSASMSDPGSNGNILTPPFATKVIKTSYKGEEIIYVEDSAKVGNYIILGLYNTDKQASLLKDILGLDSMRSEWQTASRAGEEEAPSFQWLIEVKEIIDEHTIKLVQPLWRDCDMKYEPAVFNAEMLENISISNLKICSTWNGLFRHHGHKRYYNMSQAIEMDYGWNAINMKRVAYGTVKNVIVENFTNPLYVLDSRNISCENIIIKGYDGHQGIKIYEHACDNLFRNIKFYNHYADMLGGEGNAYGNVFSEIYYLNPSYKPADFDFHGFSEGPMSPPSHNLFELIFGFSRIHCSGAIYNLPSCAQYNVWWNCLTEGEKKGCFIYNMGYLTKLTFRQFTKILIYTLATCVKNKKNSTVSTAFQENLYKRKSEIVIPIEKQSCLIKNHFFIGFLTKANLNLLDKDSVNVEYKNAFHPIHSLYEYQKGNLHETSLFPFS